MAGSLGPGLMFIHGMVTNTYHIWRGIRQRCNNPNHPRYADYGGRGLQVCPEWDESFLRFQSDMGERPSLALSIERRDNNDGYHLGNCYWGTAVEQVRNRRVSPFVEYKGQRMHLMDACAAAGIPYNQGIHKLYRDRPFDTPSRKQVLTTPDIVATVTRLLTDTTMTERAISLQLGISQKTVSKIRAGGWRNDEPLRPPPRPFTGDDAVQVMAELNRGDRPIDVAERHGISRSLVYEIRAGRIHQQATGLQPRSQK